MAVATYVPAVRSAVSEAADRGGEFRPAWWLPGGHLQTIVPNTLRWRRGLSLRRQHLTLPDGDFVAVDWAPDPGGPIVVLLHGLGGGSGSAYARGLMRALHDRGFWACTMHFRGASGRPNRKPRSYHMGESEDPRYVLGELRRRHNARGLAAVGVSLGGSALLHSIATEGEGTGVDCAVAVSVPFSLHVAEQRFNRGFSRLYQRHILRQLRRQWRRKCDVLARRDMAEGLDGLRTFRQFDTRITAPLHGFRDVDDYYDRASSIGRIRYIRVPTLLISAENDPFMTPEGLPAPEHLSDCVILERHAQGGHVGFLESNGRSYLERRIPDYLLEQFRNG